VAVDQHVSGRPVSTFPLIVSVDDHIQEPAELWVTRIPDRYAAARPHIVRERFEQPSSVGAESVWGDVWHYEDVRVPVLQAHVAAGMPPDDVETRPCTYEEMRPGCYDPVARLDDMDLDGVAASLCFPNLFVRFCGQRFLEALDKDLALACVRAYNDFLAEEWCAGSGGRLAGAAIVPLWDAVLAADEVRRIAPLGLRAICFSELPTRLELPSLYSGAWEPLLDACEETGTLVCIHVGSSSTNLTSSPDAPSAVPILNHYASSSLSLTDWVLSGALLRHPFIRVVYSEGQAGWIPYLCGRMDVVWAQGYKFHDVARRLPDPPSTYVRNQVYACVTSDPQALRYLDEFGADTICFETDYPHPDSTWPRSVEVARRQFDGLSEEHLDKVVRLNGARLLGIAPPE
jgi:predicted TIM-barrel fold metal-dependent hydrolase